MSHSTIYSTRYSSPVGVLTLAGTDNALVGLWIEGQKYFSDTLTKTPKQQDNLPVFQKTKAWLDRYFAGERPEPAELSLAPDGGGFRRIVWKLLLEIPYGQTTTYGELAKKVAVLTKKEHMSAQAVGGAVGHNPISIIIPCHRVIGADGSLTGYAGGIELKRQLLLHEGILLQEKEKPNPPLSKAEETASIRK